MDKNGHANGNGNLGAESGITELTLRDFTKELRIFQDAVSKAQEENRLLGIPNWYQIDGKIVSDIQLAELEKAKQK